MKGVLGVTWSRLAATVFAMIRSVDPGAWYSVSFVVLFLGVVMAAMLLFTKWIRKEDALAQLQGYCCLHQGDACIVNSDPVSCSDAGGFAFAREEIVCAIACASLSSPHADSTGN